MKLSYLLLMAPQGQGAQQFEWYSFLPLILILSVIAAVVIYSKRKKKKNAPINPQRITGSGQPSVTNATPPTFEERFEQFSRIISGATMKGYQVADRNDKTLVAVLIKPKEKINHLLHFFISVISCGFWLLVWLILAITAAKEERVRISIDTFGNYSEERITV